ncbi:hypothetical protein LJK88_15365 [Paenibacillus sp. P26]|nr:hypothetical protein LJK88_15365 [Paenibacillus sp. P26]
MADSQAVLAGPGGIRQAPVGQVFGGQPRFGKGEFLLQILTPASAVEWPFYTVKKTKMEIIDYPIVRIAGLRTEEGIRVAFSGVSAAPFRSLQLESILNDRSVPLEQRIEHTVHAWPAPILNDILASEAYRAFVLRYALYDTMVALGG